MCSYKMIDIDNTGQESAQDTGEELWSIQRNPTDDDPGQETHTAMC